MFHVLIRDLDGAASLSPMEVRTIFRMIIPGDSSVVYLCDGIDLADPQNYCVHDLRIGGRSQFSATSGRIPGIPGEVFVSSPDQIQFDPVVGGSTIDLELTNLSGDDPPFCTVRLVVIETSSSAGT